MNYQPNNNNYNYNVPNVPNSFNQPNNNFRQPGYRGSSAKPLVSMIGAIVCAAIAAIALFIPVFSINSDYSKNIDMDYNSFKFSFLDKGKDIVDEADKALDYGVSGDIKKAYESEKVLVVATTIAIFALAFTLVGVIIGKVLERNGGNTTLAMVASIVGVCAAVFVLIAAISFSGNANTVYKDLGASKDVLGLGAGVIMMTLGSIGSLVFCIVGKNAR